MRRTVATLIIQLKFPLQVLNEAPDFIEWCINNLVVVTTNLRDEAASSGLGGPPFRWVESDIRRLLARSM
jgi:hypothetical protein